MSFLAGPSRRNEQQPATATYRHLLTPAALTVSNPLRCIAHCDIDAAYAQFESVRLGIPDDVPLICAQWQSIIAVNYPARKYGIKRFNTIDEAKKMCPHLYVQHVATYRNGESEAGYWGEVDPQTHKVSLDPYRRESLKILAIFKEMTPKGEIEKASIDEAFLDLTEMVIDRLLGLHPHLATVPGDAPDGIDSPLPPAPPVDWMKAGNVFPIEGDKSNKESQPARTEIEGEAEGGQEQDQEDGRGHEPSSQRSDGGSHGVADAEVTWEDWALCLGAELMADIREEVWKRLHYTCSAGIAHNKAMAKLCSAWKKPNNQTILRKAATPAFLRDMDFTDIRFLGGKLGNAIATEYGAKTVGDMLSVTLDDMQSRFGEESIWVYNILRGVDHTEVKERTATKSMLASKNTRPAVTTPEQGMHWIGVLAGELHVRLRDAREITPGLWPKTLVLGHRTGIEASRSRQIPFPFTRTLSTEYIVKYAKKLWDEVCQPMKNGHMKLNNMSLSFTGLDKLETGQRGIEGFFGNGASFTTLATASTSSSPTKVKPLDPPKRGREVSSTPEVAGPNTGSGPGTGISPKRARLPTLHTGPSRKTALESFLLPKRGESSRSASASLSISEIPGVAIVGTKSRNEAGLSQSESPHDPQPDIIAISPPPTAADTGWTCPKCGFRIEAVVSAETRRETQQEHEDFHFAQQLQDAGSSPVLARKSTAKPKAKIKKPEGIKAFFTPRSSGPGTG